MSELEDLKIRIVSVIGSEKFGCTEEDLYHLYKDLYGKDLRPEVHGFADLKALLSSALMQGPGGLVCRNGRYFAAGDADTIKMLELVRQTKSKTRKKPRSKGSKRSASHVSSARAGPSGVVKKSSVPTIPPNPLAKIQQQRLGSQRPVKKLKAPTIPPNPLARIEQKRPESSSTSNRVVKIGPSRNLQVTVDDKISHPPTPPSVNLLQFNRILKKILFPTHLDRQASGSYRSAKSTKSGQTSGNQSVKSTAASSQVVDNRWAQYMTSNQASKNNRVKFSPEYHECNAQMMSQPSTSGIQRHQPQQFQFDKGDYGGALKASEGQRRLMKLIERNGGEMLLSNLKRAYEHHFLVPLDNAELCLLFDATEEEVQQQYPFFCSRLCNFVRVTKQANGDLLLQTLNGDVNQFNGFEETIGAANSEISSLPKSDNELPYCRRMTSSSAIRSQGVYQDCLSYKALGDKVLSFVREKGPLKVNDLSRIFFEEDGRNVDPRNYPEGTWEKIIQRVLLTSGHSELVLQDGVLDFREYIQKTTTPFKTVMGNQNSSNQPVSNPTDDDVFIATAIYDFLVEAGGSVLQNEVLEMLAANGIEINQSQLAIKMMNKFRGVFRWQFAPGGASVSLERGAARPNGPNTSILPRLPMKSIRITTHVMSDYCSTTDNIVLKNIELVNDPSDKLRIQASFRLCILERQYNLFEEELYLHYRCHVEDVNYAVIEPVEGENYVLYDCGKKRAYRVQCLGDEDCSDMVPVYLIDQLRHEEVPISQLRKLSGKFARPAFGVVAQTTSFTIVHGKEKEFHESFAYIRSNLLQQIEEDIRAHVFSDPSKELFELRQLYTEAYGRLNVPAKFVQQNLIKMSNLQSSPNENETSMYDLLNGMTGGPPGFNVKQDLPHVPVIIDDL